MRITTVPLDTVQCDPANLRTHDERNIAVIQGSLQRFGQRKPIVVGDFRDKKGDYRGFVGDTVAAFRAAGLSFYNDAVLVTAVGSLPIRVGKQFEAGRKLGKTHQNVLVFVKGDAKKATEAVGPVAIKETDQWQNQDQHRNRQPS